MLLILKSPRLLFDITHKKQVRIAAGTYDARRIENPFVAGGVPWIVVGVGNALIGASEPFLQGWSNPQYGNKQVILKK